MKGLCSALWDAREAGELPRWAPIRLVKLLYAAAMEEMAGDCHYDPETDVRVHWVREILEGMRRGEKQPQAEASSEAQVEMLLKKGEFA